MFLKFNIFKVTKIYDWIKIIINSIIIYIIIGIIIFIKFIIIWPNIMLIERRMVNDRIWNIILFNSIKLIIHIIIIGVFLGDKFIIMILLFFIIIIIAVIHKDVVNKKFIVIVLDIDIILGIKFIIFIITIIILSGMNSFIDALLFLFVNKNLFILFIVDFIV